MPADIGSNTPADDRHLPHVKTIAGGWQNSKKEKRVEAQKIVRKAYFFWYVEKSLYLVYFCNTTLAINIDSWLPIVLFAG